MTVMMAVAIAVICGVPPVVIATHAAAWWAPWPALAVVGVAAVGGVRARAGGPGPGVMALVAMSSELRAGQSLRMAVVAAASGDNGLQRARRLALAGAPIRELAQAVARETGPNQELVEAVFAVAARTGAATAEVFEELTAQALALDDLRRERRAAAAPMILQGAIVGGVPMVVLFSMLASGSLGRALREGGIEAAMVVAGSVLVAAGIAITAIVVKRAAR